MTLAKRIAIPIAIAAVTLSFTLLSLKALRYYRWHVLLSYENRDLRNMSEQSAQNLTLTVNAIVNTSDFHFFPRAFRTMTNTTGQSRHVLVLEQPAGNVPGESRIRAYVFDGYGKLLTNTEFSGGWRADVARVDVSKDELLNQDALAIDSHYWGGPSEQQYFVLDHDSIVPAYTRTEGKLTRERYLQTNLTIAPSIR
jgi:hypothetical protein